jgi:DNA-binding response OmpR family regulator
MTDLVLPDGLGWSVAETVKAMNPTTIIILLTGIAVDAKSLWCHKIDYYLPKPFDVQILQLLVAKCLA